MNLIAFLTVWAWAGGIATIILGICNPFFVDKKLLKINIGIGIATVVLISVIAALY